MKSCAPIFKFMVHKNGAQWPEAGGDYITEYGDMDPWKIVRQYLKRLMNI